MIIRGTSKILKISGIKPVKNTDTIVLPQNSVETQNSATLLPGEWYAGLVSTGRQGKLAIHFLHYPTMLTVLVSGKSLNKALPLFKVRAQNLIKRLGYSKLIFQYQLQTEPQIYTTNSRSMVSHMNQLRMNIEYHLAMAESVDEIDWDYIEDVHFDWLFSRDKKYTSPSEILNALLNS